MATPRDRLELQHELLETHYSRLRERRNETGGGFPIFALEHGLAEAELAQLKADICDTVRLGQLPSTSWLPLVVYATEIGYEYSGDEYWQTFEARTPGWIGYGDRGYIRRRFTEFKEKYGGAQPTGVWAHHFSIICWPITHAILPTDLQRHLARLLFEYRRALTSELLGDPEELGRRLAARSWQASSRFQNFAQNSHLLGQVAASLLVGDDEESPIPTQLNAATDCQGPVPGEGGCSMVAGREDHNSADSDTRIPTRHATDRKNSARATGWASHCYRP